MIEATPTNCLHRFSCVVSQQSIQQCLHLQKLLCMYRNITCLALHSNVLCMPYHQQCIIYIGHVYNMKVYEREEVGIIYTIKVLQKWGTLGTHDMLVDYKFMSEDTLQVETLLPI